MAKIMLGRNESGTSLLEKAAYSIGIRPDYHEALAQTLLIIKAIDPHQHERFLQDYMKLMDYTKHKLQYDPFKNTTPPAPNIENRIATYLPKKQKNNPAQHHKSYQQEKPYPLENNQHQEPYNTITGTRPLNYLWN
ncbi:hypothetical protein KAR91_27235 [Candidatus Pacearchaeota archaeon]|nr:hypothetical protein [Candidatus Pacearchaeota archaeon]